jgi:rhodanese-related sulfurtransferase
MPFDWREERRSGYALSREIPPPVSTNRVRRGFMTTTTTVGALAAAHADGAVVIDVREPGEYVGGHVPGAVLMPMGQLPSRVAELDRSRPVFVICASGNRSRAMADYLERVGFDARSVDGGTAAWVQSGHPVVRGARPAAA